MMMRSSFGLARLACAVLLALAAGAAEAQQSVPSPGAGVPLEFSSDLDHQSVASGGVGALDPGQVLYVEPPDATGSPYPNDALDFAPGLESGSEPDEQVDALANGNDAQFDELVANTAELFLSFRPD